MLEPKKKKEKRAVLSAVLSLHHCEYWCSHIIIRNGKLIKTEKKKKSLVSWTQWTCCVFLTMVCPHRVASQHGELIVLHQRSFTVPWGASGSSSARCISIICLNACAEAVSVGEVRQGLIPHCIACKSPAPESTAQRHQWLKLNFSLNQIWKVLSVWLVLLVN